MTRSRNQAEIRSISRTMPNLCTEWKKNKLKPYTQGVRDKYERMADVISHAFQEFHAAAVTTKNCADFLRANFGDKANTARKYAGVLREMFKYGISELGLRESNPCDNLDLSDYETKRREIDIATARAAIAKIRTAALTGEDGLPTESGPTFQCMIDMAYLCWQRAIDVRVLRDSQIADGMIRLKPSKTKNSSGKVIDIVITPAIQAVLDRADSISKRDKKDKKESSYLFPSRKGTPYAKSGLNSMWTRAETRAEVTFDVTSRDLRSTGAIDAALSGEERKAIQKRLAHTSAKTTEIYLEQAIPETSEIDLGLNGR
jgi:integrase